MGAADDHTHNRVSTGLKEEAKIIERLRDSGLIFTKATEEQDKLDKIDGFVTYDGNEGEPIPTQIKFRDSAIGKDILYEVYKNIATDTQGRDYIGKSDLYVCRVKSGGLYMASSKKLKDLTDRHLKKYGCKAREYPYYMFKVTDGKGDEIGTKKLLGFFSPKKFGDKV